MRRPRQWVGYAFAWLVAAVLAITVGLVAVSSVGASMRGHGPIGSNELIRNAELNEGTAIPDPFGAVVRDIVRGEFGEFVVECQGVYAVGVDARADRAAGWRTVSYEPGPDDDVDAVFANQRRSIELEVFCNEGRPTLAQIERKTLPSNTN